MKPELFPDLVASQVLEELEALSVTSNFELSEELGLRARSVARDAARVAMHAAAGGGSPGELEELQAALAARMALLEASASIVAARGVRAAIRRVLLGAVKLALAAVI